MTSLMQPLEIGDLVEFHASGPTAYAVASYPSSGIIIHIRPPTSIDTRIAYTVVWGGGAKTTTEWRCYLRKLS
jgi:hypothetical protein